MKKKLTALMLFCILLICPGMAFSEVDEAIKNQIEDKLWEYDLSIWQEAADSFSEQTRMLWDGLSMREWMLNFIGGEWEKNDESAPLGIVKEMLLPALRGNLAMIGTMLGAALFSGMIALLFEGEKGLRDILLLICSGMVISASAAYYLRLIAAAGDTMRQLSGFAEKTTPVLSVMLAATGNLGSAGMLQPLLAFLCGSVMTYFTNLALPLLSAAGLLSVAGSLAGRGEMQRFAKLIKSFCKWSTGLIFTTFLGAVSLRGMSAAGADSIALRTAKYTLDKSIPVVGGAVSGTLDTVRGCAELIKNAAGAATMITTIAYVLEPAIQIAAASMILRISAALCAPLAEGSLVKMLEELGELCGFILAAVLSCAMMFMILAGLCIAAGSLR